MSHALRKLLYEKDALGTATVIEVTPEELKALWATGYNEGWADCEAGES